MFVRFAIVAVDAIVSWGECETVVNNVNNKSTVNTVNTVNVINVNNVNTVNNANTVKDKSIVLGKTKTI